MEPKEKITFSIKEIKIDDSIGAFNVELLKSNPPTKENPYKIGLEIGLDVDEQQDLLTVKTTCTFSAEEQKLGTLSVLSIYQIKNLKKQVNKKEKEIELKNQAFLFFLVETSMSHLRGIYSVKTKEMTGHSLTMPFIQAKKILTKENLLTERDQD